jgi:hypothetical protein
MADYFPLLSRAVASLGDSTPDQRKAIYDRARVVLNSQLEAIQPKLTGEHIERELRAFDEGVARVERETQRLEDLTQTAAPVPVQKTITPQPTKTPDPSVLAPDQGRPGPSWLRSIPGSGPSPMPVSPPFSPVASSTQTMSGASDQRPMLTGTQGPAPQLEARAAHREPRDEADQLALANELIADVDLSLPDGGDNRPRIEGVRKRDRSWLRPIVLGVVIFLVVISLGITAFLLRDKPADFEKPAASAAVEQPRKSTERLRVEARPGEAAPVAASVPQAAQAPLPLLQRAALFEETSDGSQAIPVTGRVVWKLETTKSAAGGADVAVRAQVIEIAGAIQGADILIRRNREPNIPASHVIEFRFTTPENGGNGKVRDIGVPEMRTVESERGSPLAGLPVPVTDNVFLMGLTNLPGEIERNTDLLRTRGWILLPIRFANGRRALLLLEKGISGDRVILDALQAWK